MEDEQRLRRHISRLKGERTMVRSTAVELESVHAEPLNSKNTISLAEARKLDLETAVLMQVIIHQIATLLNYLTSIRECANALLFYYCDFLFLEERDSYP